MIKKTEKETKATQNTECPGQIIENNHVVQSDFFSSTAKLW